MNAEGLSQPKSHKAEVLYFLIMHKRVSCIDFPWMSGFRTRVSDLKIKHYFPIKTVMREGISKYNNSYKYAEHKLDCDINEAITRYNIINQ